MLKKGLYAEDNTCIFIGSSVTGKDCVSAGLNDCKSGRGIAVGIYKFSTEKENSGTSNVWAEGLALGIK